MKNNKCQIRKIIDVRFSKSFANSSRNLGIIFSWPKLAIEGGRRNERKQTSVFSLNEV